MKKEERWEFWLNIAGPTAKSILTLHNITQYSREHLLAKKYIIEVIDLLKSPQLAEEDQIFAIPTLVRKAPKPFLKIIGDPSNKERVLKGLNILPLSIAHEK